ncbi:hypothetical protein, partial [Vibrio parahaemolyticus]|uniref:hypothetical protein n=1 Tax=Vibrio parahaemolyticus TaxID=670 RepID=UPI00211472D8
GEGSGPAVSAAGGTANGAGTRAVSGSKAVAGKTAAATLNGNEIVIGSVGSISGIVGAALKPGVEGLRVWVQWINSKGGLN